MKPRSYFFLWLSVSSSHVACISMQKDSRLEGIEKFARSFRRRSNPRHWRLCFRLGGGIFNFLKRMIIIHTFTQRVASLLFFYGKAVEKSIQLAHGVSPPTSTARNDLTQLWWWGHTIRLCVHMLLNIWFHGCSRVARDFIISSPPAVLFFINSKFPMCLQ